MCCSGAPAESSRAMTLLMFFSKTAWSRRAPVSWPTSAMLVRSPEKSARHSVTVGKTEAKVAVMVAKLSGVS